MAHTTKPVAYPDANIWIAPYDEPNQWPLEVLNAVNQILEWHRAGRIELVTSFGVERDIDRAGITLAKFEKAKQGRALLDSMQLRHLVYSAGYYGDPVKGRFGYARFGTAEVFQKSNLKDSQDRDALDFLPMNKVPYFVTLDRELNDTRKREIEEHLQTEGTRIVTPVEFVKSL